MYRVHAKRAAMLAALLASSAGTTGALAQSTMFCLRSGEQIKAGRFESRDGKFYLYIGSNAPLEYTSNAVLGINVTCPAGPAASAASVIPISATAPVGGTGDGFSIHGSNTIGERLMPMLVEAYSQKRLNAKHETKFGAPEEQEITINAPGGRVTRVDLKAHGSGTSAKALAEGKSQIGMSSRRANDAEVQAVQTAQQVDLRTPGSEHVLALDGLAVIVNPANRVRELTLDQIAAIFSGQIRNWNEVGGANAPIVTHRRDDKSGTFDTFNALVLAPRNVKSSPQAKAHESSENLSEEVAKDPNAIGFIGMPYINRNHAVGIADACGLASGPTKFGVKTETYPMARRLYLYTLGQPRNAMARDLLQFSLSDDAQPTIQEAGFIEQTVELQGEAEQRQWLQALSATPAAFLPAGKAVPEPARAAMLRSLSATRRTSLVLRFERASAVLDTRALQDVQRFARYLRSPPVQGKRFWIAGFADSDGGWQTNVRLSADRATSVRRALEQSGIQIANDQILNFSYQAPVACNDSDAGKAKNRRVEVWIAQ